MSDCRQLAQNDELQKEFESGHQIPPHAPPPAYPHPAVIQIPANCQIVQTQRSPYSTCRIVVSIIVAVKLVVVVIAVIVITSSS